MFSRAPGLLATLLVVLPPLLPACGVANVSKGCLAEFKRPNIAALTNDLAAARLRWKAADIQDYSYEYAETGFVPFPSPRKVTVQGGRVTATAWVDPKPEYPTLELSETIDQRFGDLAGQITITGQSSCYELSVSYDAADGHPLRLFGGTSGTALAEISDGFGGLNFSNFTRP